MKKINRESEIEKKLVDFTDRVLAGKSGQPESNADEELRRLEETILRLKRALPRTESDEAAMKQLDSRLMARLRQEKKSLALPFWHKWFGWVWRRGQFRPLAAVAVSLLVLAAVAVISVLLFPVSSPSVSASELGDTRAAIAVIALTGLILALVWVNRRK